MSASTSRVLAALLGLGLIVFFLYRARQARSLTVAIVGVGTVLIFEVAGAIGIYYLSKVSHALSSVYIAVLAVGCVMILWNFPSVSRSLWRWWMTKTGRL